MIREIHVDSIIESIEKAFIDINIKSSKDIDNLLDLAIDNEVYPKAKQILKKLQENNTVASKTNMPICQDTGMAIVFVDLGQDVHVVGGDFYSAINEGVRRAYKNAYLRKSVVKDPIHRENTGDNTPAIIHTNITSGNKIKIDIMAKGFGSENMSALKIMTPSEGMEGVERFVLETVNKAGASPCPPIVIGIGVGGSFEKCALLSKEAIMKDLDKENENEFYASWEKRILSSVNELGIGPQGFGGSTTALAVKIKTYPTHIASLPVAVNIACHVTRHKEIII